MRIFMSVRGRGAVPNSSKVFTLPRFPCRMLVRLHGKMPIYGKELLEIECENPLSLREMSEEIETISEQFFNDMNERIENKTLELELPGKHADAYKIRNTVPAYGYDIYAI